MQLGTLLRDALEVVRRYPRLWVFGLFVAGASGGGTGGGGAPGAAGGSRLDPTWLVLIVGAALLLVFLAIFLHVVSEGGLIAEVARTRDHGPASLRRGWRDGVRCFWPVLGVKALAGLVFVITGVVVAAPLAAVLVFGVSPWLGFPVAAVIALVSVPWVVTVAFVYFWALRLVVLEGAGVVASVQAAIGLLHGRLVDALKVLVADIIGLLVGGVAAFLVAVLVVALVFVGHAVAEVWGAVVVGVLVGLPLAVLVGGALGTWRSTVWTLGFLAVRRS